MEFPLVTDHSWFQAIQDSFAGQPHCGHPFDAARCRKLRAEAGFVTPFGARIREQNSWNTRGLACRWAAVAWSYRPGRLEGRTRSKSELALA
jgi:hypothetical protein